MRELQPVRETGAQGLQSAVSTWLCRNEVFLFRVIRTSEIFSFIFQKENFSFSLKCFSVFSTERNSCAQTFAFL